MIWQAAGIELLTIALAVVVLLCDLFGPRRAVFALAGVGLIALLAGSFFAPAGGTLGPAYVQDAFALLVKRVMLAATLLAVVGLAPHARKAGASDRSGEAIVLLLFAAVGGMALASGSRSSSPSSSSRSRCTS
jgi:NADH:ubiquinone oxidoreductase subunit 2 (subunit N)